MNVACGACPAKYVIPDEKVKGRKVRIPCKHCGAAIIVDGTVAPGASAQTMSNAPAAENPAASEKPAKPEAKAPAAPVVNPRPTEPAASASPPKTSQAPWVPLPVAPQKAAQVEPPPPAAPQKPAPFVPTQAARAQRAIRQTIIGVAAPANAPQSLPGPPVRRPTPIYVRAASAEPIPAPGAPDQAAAPQASGQVRSMRRTMLGGLDGDAPALADASPSTAVARPPKRDIKQTIIGGLEAPAGSAPGAVEPPKRPRPTQETPPGVWLAALPDGKTLKIAERDLHRAVKKAYISMQTPLWRSSMSDWQPLGQIPELLSLLNKSSTLPQALSNETPAPAPLPTQADGRSGLPNLVSSPPGRSLPPADTKRSALPFQAPPIVPPRVSLSKAPPAVPAPPRVNQSSDSPHLSAPPAAEPKLASLNPSKAGSYGFSATRPQVSRGPASVSARSSSPTLELMEIRGEEEIADIVSAEASVANTAAQGAQDLERLAAKPASKGSQKAAAAASEPGLRAAAATAAQPSGVAGATNRTVELGDGVNTDALSAGSASRPSSGSARVTLPASRRKRSRTLAIVIVSLLVLGALVGSYLTRQPRPLYGYLHAKGWEQSIDGAVRKVSGPVSNQFKKWFRR